MFEMRSVGVSQAIARLEGVAVGLEVMDARLIKASDAIYDATRERFDTEGDGEWPPLAESTVAKKASQGYSEPERALYAEGNLYESATSPNGPYSQRIVEDNLTVHRVIMLVDWENDGWQIPTVLTQGTDDAGAGHHTVIPARPIWPDADKMRDRIREILMGISV